MFIIIEIQFMLVAYDSIICVWKISIHIICDSMIIIRIQWFDIRYFSDFV